uniref:Uncharacterized protein n=1 Tax=Romanomermis culicivorax TaxID=13658 RepID=A0A915K9E6_ROMCU
HYNDEASVESYLHLRRIEENDKNLLHEISDGLEVNLETKKCTKEKKILIENREPQALNKLRHKVDTILVQVAAFDEDETIGNKSNINKN